MIINGKVLEVHDDMPESINNELSELAKVVKYTKTESSIKDNHGFNHWMGEINVNYIEGTKMFSFIREKVSKYWKLQRAYINSLSFGDQTFAHEDSDIESLTVLVYILDYEWLLDFGGETIYYSADKIPQLAVVPRRGRYVIADGRLLHVGRPPTRYFIENRLTLALKFEKNNG